MQNFMLFQMRHKNVPCYRLNFFLWRKHVFSLYFKFIIIIFATAYGKRCPDFVKDLQRNPNFQNRNRRNSNLKILVGKISGGSMQNFMLFQMRHKNIPCYRVDFLNPKIPVNLEVFGKMPV